KGKSSYMLETVVQAPFSANVAMWSAKDGTFVNQNDPLYTLDDTPLRKEIELQTAILRKQELENKLKAAEQITAFRQTNSLAINETEALQHHAQQASHEAQAELEQLNRSIAVSELEKKQELLKLA